MHGTIRLPIAVDSTRGLGLCEGERDHVRQAVQLIVCTRPGTRPLAPGFGCRIHELLFRPFTSRFRAQAAFFIEQALVAWEPRIHIDRVEVEAPGPDATGIGADGAMIRVAYRLRDEPGEEVLIEAFAIAEQRVAPSTIARYV